MLLIKILPTILLSICLAKLLLSILLITINKIFIIEWDIILLFRINIKLDIILEWRNLIYSSTIIFISSIVIKFSKEYIKNDPNKFRFSYIILIFIISINILVFIPNLIYILIGWDGLGITSFILVIYYNNSRSLRARILTIMTNRLGDVFLILAIVTILNTRNWLPINNIIRITNNYHSIQWLRIIIAAITKSAQIPFSRWLPAAIAAPTPVSALVHSSTLVTAGVFLLYRFNNLIYLSTNIQLILITRRIITTLIAGLIAIHEKDIKKIIALSTLRQLGLIITCLRLNIPILTFFHIITHAIFKALLFITAGCLIINNNHNQDLRLYRQYSNISPITSSSIIISTIALAGIPFITGYYSKHTIIEWSSNILINSRIFILLLLTIFITSFYSIRLILLLLLSSNKQPIFIHKYHYNTRIPQIIISIISIIIGSILQWLLPSSPTSIQISENYIHITISYLIIFRIITIILIKTLKKQIILLSNIKLLKLNKISSSIIYLRSISTQFLIPKLIKPALFLYKYLDQNWIENITSMGFQQQLNNKSSNINTILFISYQKILIHSLLRLRILRLTYMCLL